MYVYITGEGSTVKNVEGGKKKQCCCRNYPHQSLFFEADSKGDIC